jgi:hypothetical protein
MFLKMSVIFIKVDEFMLNGLGWGSHGPIIKEIPRIKKEDTLRKIPLFFTDHETINDG